MRKHKIAGRICLVSLVVILIAWVYFLYTVAVNNFKKHHNDIIQLSGKDITPTPENTPTIQLD